MSPLSLVPLRLADVAQAEHEGSKQDTT